MFDSVIDKEPESLEETFENLEVLNKRLVTKLNEQGLDYKFDPI